MKVSLQLYCPNSISYSILNFSDTPGTSDIFLAGIVNGYRLVNDNNDNKTTGNLTSGGRLEFLNLYYDFEVGVAGYDWLPICISSFDFKAADYFCGKLGYLKFEQFDTVHVCSSVAMNQSLW